MLKQIDIRDGIVAGACERFGYDPSQVQMRFYVGKFAGGDHESRIRQWALTRWIGGGPVLVIGAEDLVADLRKMALSSQYRDHPVLATLKVLQATGELAN